MAGWIVGALALGYFFWQVERSLNYNIAYEKMVRDTVVEMVKPACLIKK